MNDDLITRIVTEASATKLDDEHCLEASEHICTRVHKFLRTAPSFANLKAHKAGSDAKKTKIKYDYDVDIIFSQPPNMTLVSLKDQVLRFRDAFRNFIKSVFEDDDSIQEIRDISGGVKLFYKPLHIAIDVVGALSLSKRQYKDFQDRSESEVRLILPSIALNHLKQFPDCEILRKLVILYKAWNFGFKSMLKYEIGTTENISKLDSCIFEYVALKVLDLHPNQNALEYFVHGLQYLKECGGNIPLLDFPQVNIASRFSLWKELNEYILKTLNIIRDEDQEAFYLLFIHTESEYNQKDLNKMKEEISNLKSLNKEKENQIESLREKDNENTILISELTAKILERDQTIDELKIEKKDLQRENMELKIDKNMISETLNDAYAKAISEKNKIRKLDEDLKRRDEIIIQLKQKQERQVQRIDELKKLVIIASNAGGKAIPVFAIKNFADVVCGLNRVKISEISGKDTLLFNFIAGGKDIIEALDKEIAIWNPIQSAMCGSHEYRICKITKIKKIKKKRNRFKAELQIQNIVYTEKKIDFDEFSCIFIPSN